MRSADLRGQLSKILELIKGGCHKALFKSDPMKTKSNLERNALSSPFGFKGGYVTELWQTIALMEGDSGKRGLGLGTQSVLWSDAAVFTAHSETDGNKLMYQMTQFALAEAARTSFETPLDLLDQLLSATY
jgi:hypothetical protein